MAVRRSFIAGLGTTGVLVAFAALLLVVMGALLGFRGWPGDGAGGDSGGVAIGDARLPGLPADLLPFATAAHPEAAAPTSLFNDRHAHRRRARDAGAVEGVRQHSKAERRAANDVVGGGAAPGARGVSPAIPSPTVKSVTDGVANTVNEVSQRAGRRLGATTPVGNLVVETGSAVSQTVHELGVEAQRPGKLPKLP
jgi:hypothetical protein